MTVLVEIDFVTPPGWVRLDLTGDIGQIALTVTDRLLAPLPPEHRAQARGKVSAALRDAALRARSAGAIQLVLPLDLDLSVTLPASFTVQPLPVPEGIDPLQAVAAMTVGDSGFEPVEDTGVFALRSADESTDDDAETRRALTELVTIDSRESRAEIDRWSTGAASRRVRSIVGDPETPGSWYLVVFMANRSADPQSQELADVLVRLFDLIMATVHFGPETDVAASADSTTQTPDNTEDQPGPSGPGQTTK